MFCYGLTEEGHAKARYGAPRKSSPMGRPNLKVPTRRLVGLEPVAFRAFAC